jgi:hypothetical protein
VLNVQIYGGDSGAPVSDKGLSPADNTFAETAFMKPFYNALRNLILVIQLAIILFLCYQLNMQHKNEKPLLEASGRTSCSGWLSIPGM